MIRTEHLKQYLAKAQSHAVKGRETIDRQIALISRLRNDGHDTSMAESILRTMVETQRLHEDAVLKLSQEINGESEIRLERKPADVAPTNEGNYLLRRLPDEDFALVQPLLQSVRYRFRERLHTANKKVNMVHFLDSGLVSIFAVSSHRRNQILIGLMGKEGMTGLPIIFASDQSPFDVEVEIEGQGRSISVDALMNVMEQSSSLREALMRSLGQVWVEIAHSTLANSTGTVVERLAWILLKGQDRLESDEIPLTHYQIATMMAVRRASVTVALQHLETSGVIERERGMITVRSRAGLEQHASHLC
jgi:CRP-like cAMP-binding protein